MPIFGWIRDALGIHKDNVEIDKTELEIKKLEAEEVARHLITPATMEDIKEYDPKYSAIKRKTGGSGLRFNTSAKSRTVLGCLMLVLYSLLAIIGLIKLAQWLIGW